MAALDVKNAFNTATWSIIVRELERREISGYLVNLISNYLNERKVQITNKHMLSVTTGVPQGSVLGPTLWNVLYDDILRQDLGENVTAVGYADDLAVVVTAEESMTLCRDTNEALRRISVWMREHNLDLAPDKTEIVILKGKKRCERVTFEIQGLRITPKKTVKYLGILLDNRLSFGEHVKAATEKAERRAAALARLLPNIGGPSSQKRAVLNGVTQSILLYGAPIWDSVLHIKKYSDMLEKTQRKMLLRVASAYKTTSTIALQVITGIGPIDLLALEQKAVYTNRREDREETWDIAKTHTRQKWQERWNRNTAKAQWTKRLIPDLEPWLKCQHKHLNYYLTQVLSGHGRFKTYTARMNLSENDKCPYCEATDTVEHTIFECERWTANRIETRIKTGEDITVENLIELMLSSPTNWREVENMIVKIMANKEKDERQNQGEGR